MRSLVSIVIKRRAKVTRRIVVLACALYGLRCHANDRALSTDFTSNCTTIACKAGVDFFAPTEMSQRTAIPRTPAPSICSTVKNGYCDDPVLQSFWDESSSEDRQSVSISDRDRDDIVELFVPELREAVRAYLANADNRGVMVFVGGWGNQNEQVGGYGDGWPSGIAEWVNQNPALAMPVIQLGYFQPCFACVDEFLLSRSDGVERAKRLHRKLLRAGASRVFWMGHSLGAEVVQTLTQWGHYRRGFAFSWSFAAPNPSGIFRSDAVPPANANEDNLVGGFFLFRNYACGKDRMCDFGGKLALFTRASDCVANRDPDLVKCFTEMLDTHDYGGVARSESFRRALWQLYLGVYPFSDEINNDPSQGDADRQAGVLFDCTDHCPP